jgi:hypothetical protein
MNQAQRRFVSAVGFTVKSGWAAAVVLSGRAKSPRVVASRLIHLSDPAVKQSRQPYHAGFATARRPGPELSRLVSSVKRFGRKSVSQFIGEYQTAGHQFRGAGVVVGSLIDPNRIANEHIRIHALEGKLFRGVVQDGAARSQLPCAIWRERDLYALAAQRFKLPEQELRARVGMLGRGVSGAWRAEQKAAAVAAWLVLARP